MIPRIMSTTTLKVLGRVSPRCTRRTANQPMLTITRNNSAPETVWNQKDMCEWTTRGYAIVMPAARAIKYQNALVLCGGTFGSRGMTTSNENKMSDGGRDRPLLEMEVWKASQK